MATLQASMKDIENKKRSLEEMVDHLNEEYSKLTAQEEMQIKSALETQIEKHREAHQKQLSALRDEISEKENAIEQLKDVNQKFLLAQEKNQIDLDKLREELNEKTAKVEELSMFNNMREQAHEEIRGLEETVARELQTLNRLRKMFVQDLLSRVRKSAAGQEDTEIGGSQIQQHKIQFLENNLDKLTYIHKQLVTENSELRREKPKLKKHIELLMGRIKDLENDLCRTKELANEEKRRYQRESICICARHLEKFYEI